MISKFEKAGWLGTFQLGCSAFGMRDWPLAFWSLSAFAGAYVVLTLVVLVLRLREEAS